MKYDNDKSSIRSIATFAWAGCLAKPMIILRRVRNDGQRGCRAMGRGGPRAGPRVGSTVPFIANLYQFFLRSGQEEGTVRPHAFGHPSASGDGECGYLGRPDLGDEASFYQLEFCVAIGWNRHYKLSLNFIPFTYCRYLS